MNNCIANPAEMPVPVKGPAMEYLTKLVDTQKEVLAELDCIGTFLAGNELVGEALRNEQSNCFCDDLILAQERMGDILEKVCRVKGLLWRCE